MKKQLFFFLMMLQPMIANAYDVEVVNADGFTIYYNYINNGTEFEVTSRGNGFEYKGNVVIPDKVTYMDRTRKVTSIGDGAFYGCTSLSSITIPNSVTRIGNSAFNGCDGLTSVTIPNSVTNIGVYAFAYCSGLTSITIPNSVTTIEDRAFFGCSGLVCITIPKSVTSIGNSAFLGCDGLRKVIVHDIVAWFGIEFGDFLSNPLSYAHHLYSYNAEITDLIIPNSVTSIGNLVFYGCSGLTSITIPNSVTRIGKSAFNGCSGLTSITIPNSVTSIGNSAFDGCSGLTSITIPNSVTNIEDGAFQNCSGMSSINIPKSVTSIGKSVFQGCTNLSSISISNSVTNIGSRAFDNANILVVVSQIENPFKIDGKASDNRTFSQNTFSNATLYVPKGTIEKYRETDGWKDFFFIEEGVGPYGGDTPVTPEPKKCDKPTISYQNGKLTFSCATDKATCQYSITDTDIKSGRGNEVQLAVIYTISVYATKSGLENSETVTATLCWIDVEPKTEGITNTITEVPSNAVLIQSEGRMLTVQGLDDGTQVSIYNMNGTPVGSEISQNGQAVVATNLPTGSVAIVKIGQKSVKVVIK